MNDYVIAYLPAAAALAPAGNADVARVFRSRAEAREGEGGGGEDKATALAEAQREVIARGGRYAHPYFWGAFVLVGRM